MGRLLQKLQRFFRELKRRNVYKVAVAYLAVAFVGLQTAQLLVPATTLPPWTDTFFLAILIIGFPIALVIAWAFEITPEGMRPTTEAEPKGGTVSPAAGTFSGWSLALVTVLLIGGGAWYLLALRGGEESTPETTTQTDPVRTEVLAANRSIAVLPFDNLSGTAEAEPFVNGIHGDLLIRLSNIADLKVISRTSVLPYRQTELSLPAIADSLGVAWIVEGGVQQAGDQVQVTAQLIEAHEDAQRWAQTYRRELTTENIFAIQSDLTIKIAQSLEAELTAEEQERVEREPTGDLSAYRLYVQGRNLLDLRTGESMRQAVEYFARALERDSSYAMAWSGMADAAGLMENYGFRIPPEVPDQEAAARRALQLEPNLAEAHASLAHYLFHQNRGAFALRHLRRAVELQPSYAQAHHWLGWLLPPLGRLDEGREHASLAVELNPRHSAAAMVYGETLVATGRAREALREFRRIRQMHPTYSATSMNEALALIHLGRAEEARRIAMEGLSQARDYAPRARVLLAVTSFALGDSEGAQHWVERMQEAGDPPAFIGLALAAIGDTDAAYASLRKEDSWPGWATIGLRYWFPDRLAAFRDDPRYRELIREINQEWGLDPDGSLPDSVDVQYESETDE